MGRDSAKAFSALFSGDTAQEHWTTIIKEFVGSMVLILVASNTGLAGGFNWAISFVVLSIVMGEKHSMNSFLTFYRGFTGVDSIVETLTFLGAQFLGGFVAGHLGGAIGQTADVISGSFGIGEWQNGLRQFFAISIFLWTMNHANSGKLGDNMPKGIFMIAAIAVCFMFDGDFIFSYHRCFMNMDSIAATWSIALWGAAACIFTHVKAKLMGVEENWFFESDSEEVGAVEEKEPVIESEA